MSDTFLVTAGIGGILIALVHGYLGKTLILGRIEGLPTPHRRVNAAVFQLSTLYWFFGGVILLLAPLSSEPSVRLAVAVMVAFIYASGALANFWGTRGRHFGGYLLAILAVLALLGG